MSKKPRKSRRKDRREGISRRRLLAGLTGGVGAAILTGKAAPDSDVPEDRPLVPDDPTKLQGPPPSELGERSPFEKPRRLVQKLEPSSSSRTPLQDLTGIITPSDLHFERHHAGVPRIDPDRHTLLIHGLVEKPTIYTLAFPVAQPAAMAAARAHGPPARQ